MPRLKRVVTVKTPDIDPYVMQLLGKITEGKRVLTFRKTQRIYSQGDPADAIFLIQSGKVKMTHA
jgi:CRP-like cAMP-binding protein